LDVGRRRLEKRETADKSRDSTIAATGVELLKSMALLIGPSSRKHLGVW
jgi:hypothetical protein